MVAMGLSQDLVAAELVAMALNRDFNFGPGSVGCQARTSFTPNIVSFRRGSTPVCIDARASINLGSASIHIKVHRSISKVHAHHFLHFLGSTLGGYPTLGGWTFTQ